MAVDDKNYLKELAKKVMLGLKEQKVAPPFIIAKKVQVAEVRSGGWAVKLGIFRGYACSVEIWFDKFTSHEERKLYYVIFSQSTRGIKKIAALSRMQMGEPVSINHSDWADDEDFVHLKKRLTIKEFGKPLFEKYPREYFYGIYQYENYGLQRNETSRLISRVVEFVGTINEVLLLDKSKREAEDYKAVENRKSVQRHLQRERKSHLVTLRKQLDNFVCHICGFDYRKTYGDLGDDFAEAHHIIPLGKNDKQRTTTIDDLITVCANCHRMLHRMNGTANDIPKLKRILKETR